MNEFPSYLRTIRTLDTYLDRLRDGRNWTIEGRLSLVEYYKIDGNMCRGSSRSEE